MLSKESNARLRPNTIVQCHADHVQSLPSPSQLMTAFAKQPAQLHRAPAKVQGCCTSWFNCHILGKFYQFQLLAKIVATLFNSNSNFTHCVKKVSKTNNTSYICVTANLALARASAEQVRKKWLMRHVAAKTSKRIQKSSFFVGKRNTSELFRVCVRVARECR